MSHPLDFLEPALSLVRGAGHAIVPDGLAPVVALPTVNPGDDDEDRIYFGATVDVVNAKGEVSYTLSRHGSDAFQQRLLKESRPMSEYR